ncbi:MAG: hypothetical protein K6E98_05160 [Lachnospiraceae bacterium]|nr:hypothetical protein [Lachnospiraceae bacterium]
MRTDNYKITGNNSDITEINKVIEKVANYNDLDEKDKNKLQLLAEELIGMEKGVLGFTNGLFHIENSGNEYRLCLHSDINIDIDTQERFVNMSKTQKNEAYKGFLGKVRLITDTFLYTPTSEEMKGFEAYAISETTSPYFSPADYDMTWAFSKYKNEIDDTAPIWDELEHSVIASFSDDLLVATRNKSVDVVVVKKF